MARIVLDTGVVSQHRAGRLPPRLARLVAGNDLSIAFATAGELWKGARARRWGGARRGGLERFLDQALILPAALKVATVWGELLAGRSDGSSSVAQRHLDRGLLYRGRVTAAHPRPS